MRARPRDLDEERLLRVLGGWGVGASSLEYAPVGFGDHHWIAAGGAGEKWFVTVADLELKGAQDAHAALRSLRGAMDTAAALRDEGHLDFVVAPLRDAGGETVRRLGPRYAVSVFPFLDGITGDFDRQRTAAERGAVLDLLAELHRAAPPASTPVLDLGLSMRDLLRSALDGAIRWAPGPFTEPARALLSGHAPAILRRLEEFDRLAEDVRTSDGAPVLTHGEPHPGNLLQYEGGHLLVDWDTVGLAPPERDLWSVAESPEDLERYAEAAGRTVDASALALYRLRWDLEEVSLYVDWFRAPHDRSPDTEEAWQGLRESVAHLGDLG
ncbi:aminoglycoside phosphotransferase family protein [Actinoallomurus sp. NBC_01490]|uniref:aminoglycoside phosphotransferase family protein n=1 Tax=Actinoallomurus sp. NBC_01490 TaxID=2903557 RepID=UPI002E30225B|nr:aminoglycoside phosphotransferase family protein [Actinoallomurus sp. NBC_01490]